jgi:hypothetical protein
MLFSLVLLFVVALWIIGGLDNSNAEENVVDIGGLLPLFPVSRPCSDTISVSACFKADSYYSELES